MRIPLFHAADTMDWPRVFSITTAAGAFWAALVSIVPERFHKYGTVIIGAAIAAITVMMRSGVSRVEKAAEKIADYEAEGIKTQVEITELMSNEAKEQAEKQEDQK